jgi:hydroxyethylthiazole kinase-like uncharacterized protein yjeF
MTAILTSAEMRAVERAAIDSGAVTGLELMERAGRGVVEAILAEWPAIEAGARRALVLCGPGNNGGDGFVVARLLRVRGWEVMAFLYGDPDTLPADARANHDRWAALGAVARLSFPDLSETDADRLRDAAGGVPGATLIVDALFGLGLARPLTGLAPILRLLERGAAEPRSARVVAVDVPSGLSADTGLAVAADPGPDAPPSAVRAQLTVTFHAAKPGHLLADGPSFCGRLRVVDIGLPPVMDAAAGRLDAAEPARHALAKRAGHKYSHGHALVLAGGPGRGGAARLAARGALRVGAGLVTLAVPPAALIENAARLDAVMLRPIRDAETLAALLADERLNAVCAGPGLGTGERQAALLAALLGEGQGARGAPLQPGAQRPALAADESPPGSRPGAARPRNLVLDADAITLLADSPELRARLHDRVVLTPHEGEFARLFPDIFARWRGPAFSKVDAARAAARALGCTVLLKGPDTVIAEPPGPASPGRDAPPGRAAIHAAAYDRAAPWLATAGTGDVLAGMICGLLARGLPPFDAAATAAWLHAEAARRFGPGLIAEDLPEELPKVFRALGL